MDLGTPSGELFKHIGPTNVFVHASPQVFFLVTFGSESGCLGFEKQAFGKGGTAKINFRRNWISHDSKVHFS